MSLRRRDVEQWMSHRRLPEELKRLHLHFPLQMIVSVFILMIVYLHIPVAHLFHETKPGHL